MDRDKYRRLYEHLLYTGKGEVRMTFAQIERVLGHKLPASARSRAAWWSNNPAGHTQAAKGWMRAGYRTGRVDLSEQCVTFTLEGWPDAYRKPDAAQPSVLLGLGEAEQSKFHGGSEGSAQERGALNADAGKPHPAWGIWKDKVTLLPDYDYTQPADPDWGKVYGD